MITDILFDFFGTLVYYTPGAFHTAPYQNTHQFLQQQGFQILYDDFIDTFTEVSNELETQAKLTFREYHMDDVGREFFQTAFAINPSDAVLKPFIAHFIAEWSRGIVYLDGISNFLERLMADYRLTIVSNTHYPALIHDHLAAMQVAPFFTHIVTSVEIGMRKPHPAIFRHTLDRLQIGPDNAIYVGDTYVDDYQGATATNISCVLLDPQNRYPQVPDRITKLFDLIPYLEQFQY